MRKKKICFIAQFPPPIHGLSKAVETLYLSNLKNEFDFEKVDITNNKLFIKNLVLIGKSNADLFYFTISQTRGGNLRDLIIMKLLQMQRKKCLVHLHGGYYRNLVDKDLGKWQRKANYKAISKAGGAIVLGESLKNIFSGMLCDEKIFVVPNCVDDEYLMSESEFEQKLKTTSEKKVRNVLYLSNFIREKGYPAVLEMAKNEKERCEAGEVQKFHFDFAGRFFDKEEEKFFFDYIKEHSLQDFVTYHGVVSGDKKRELLKLGDFFVLLTRYPNEGQPISILEAMGNGMVILTTDHAGIPDIVKDGKNGITLHLNESIKLLEERMKNIDEKAMMRLNRREVIVHYGEEVYLKHMEECFFKV